jgi:hypothetical protein
MPPLSQSAGRRRRFYENKPKPGTDRGAARDDFDA